MQRAVRAHGARGRGATRSGRVQGGGEASKPPLMADPPVASLPLNPLRTWRNQQPQGRKKGGRCWRFAGNCTSAHTARVGVFFVRCVFVCGCVCVCVSGLVVGVHGTCDAQRSRQIWRRHPGSDDRTSFRRRLGPCPLCKARSRHRRRLKCGRSRVLFQRRCCPLPKARMAETGRAPWQRPLRSKCGQSWCDASPQSKLIAPCISRRLWSSRAPKDEVLCLHVLF